MKFIKKNSKDTPFPDFLRDGKYYLILSRMDNGARCKSIYICTKDSNRHLGTYVPLQWYGDFIPEGGHVGDKYVLGEKRFNSYHMYVPEGEIFELSEMEVYSHVVAECL